MSSSSAGSFDALPMEEPFPGVCRRTFCSEQATVAEYVFDPDARFPLHRHDQEQITLVREGDLELVADGRRQRLAAGAWSVIAGGVEHGITAGRGGARFLAVLVPRRAPDEALAFTDPTTERL
jgi:quercetin dioxygenase-like cupin family protein